jgi:hypothetical protein
MLCRCAVKAMAHQLQGKESYVSLLGGGPCHSPWSVYSMCCKAKREAAVVVAQSESSLLRKVLSPWKRQAWHATQRSVSEKPISLAGHMRMQ